MSEASGLLFAPTDVEGAFLEGEAPSTVLPMRTVSDPAIATESTGPAPTPNFGRNRTSFLESS